MLLTVVKQTNTLIKQAGYLGRNILTEIVMRLYKDILTKGGNILKKTVILIGIIFFIFFLYLMVSFLIYEYIEKPEIIDQCVETGHSLEICKGRFD